MQISVPEFSAMHVFILTINGKHEYIVALNLFDNIS